MGQKHRGTALKKLPHVFNVSGYLCKKDAPSWRPNQTNYHLVKCPRKQNIHKKNKKNKQDNNMHIAKQENKKCTRQQYAYYKTRKKCIWQKFNITWRNAIIRRGRGVSWLRRAIDGAEAKMYIKQENKMYIIKLGRGRASHGRR
jgi:hypothetical protein